LISHELRIVIVSKVEKEMAGSILRSVIIL
jgi:hypothetical protein